MKGSRRKNKNEEQRKKVQLPRIILSQVFVSMWLEMVLICLYCISIALKCEIFLLFVNLETQIKGKNAKKRREYGRRHAFVKVFTLRQPVYTCLFAYLICTKAFGILPPIDFAPFFSVALFFPCYSISHEQYFFFLLVLVQRTVQCCCSCVAKFKAKILTCFVLFRRFHFTVLFCTPYRHARLWWRRYSHGHTVSSVSFYIRTLKFRMQIYNTICNEL